MGDRLLPGQALGVGDSLTSPNGKYQLILQTDGNLVLYRLDTRAPLWASNTYNTLPSALIMQDDGNLVVYGDKKDPDFPPGGPGAGRTPLWASNTFGKPGAWLLMQDDGNAVVYWPSFPAWASNTYQG